MEFLMDLMRSSGQQKHRKKLLSISLPGKSVPGNRSGISSPSVVSTSSDMDCSLQSHCRDTSIDVREAASDGSVLAVVVTYQPDETLAHNLRALCEQIDSVIVVDNGSTNIAAVETATTHLNCRLIKNFSNLGIAYALNQGAAIAMSEGFTWLATFDQDSRVTPGMVSGLLALHQLHPMKSEVGMLVAFHNDRETGLNYDDPRDVLLNKDDWMLMRTTITSGCLISTLALREAGPFDDTLFIDCVDHDFNMRCRRRGFLIVGAKRHILLHSLGRTTEHRLLGKRIICTNHSAIRRYYMTRNQLEVYARYAAFEPVWCAQGLWRLLSGSISALIFERDRFNKLRGMLKGVCHFVLRRFGRLDDWP